MVDVRGVSYDICMDDERILETLARGSKIAGMKVLNQIRYKFSDKSTPDGCTAIVMLDTSHASAHVFADSGQICWDMFTCGPHDPLIIWEEVQKEFGFVDFDISVVPRFK